MDEYLERQFSIVNCGVCEKMCPVKAITKGEVHREVDEEKCIDCYVCEIECPVNAAYLKS